ncbi:MAG: M48 family metallopeptidase [Pyrinomonadaceae bacterium]|nr:M48 family metallopeptidase [Pyrinomonadaceae bacterium]
MRNNSIRKFGAYFVMSAIWFGAISFYPASVAAQTTADKKQSDKEKKNKKDKKKEVTTAQTTPTPAATNAKTPLGAKEDPTMIGKRNVNNGSDKFFGWLGGSKEKEIAIGRQAAAEVEQQAKLIDDPIVTEYINRVGQNIVLNSDSKVPFTIKVIDSDEVNAFALPGGFFYVNKGLILAADSESELAGVMAHEIAHVAARHAMENQGKMSAINYGMLAGIIFGGGIASTVLQNAGGLTQAMAFFKFSRGAEEEADRLGVQYLYASGYDPTGMATMFEKLNSKNKKKPGTLSKLFSSHPQSLERRDASLSLVARFPEKEEYIISTSEFQRVKAHLFRISNVKAGVISDIDENDPGKPTLKRRQPEPDATDSSDSTTESSSDAPKLKRRSEEPAPKPSPSPEK